MGLIQLSQRHRVVKPRQQDIPAVHHLRPVVEWAFARVDTDRSRVYPLAADPDPSRAEARAGAPGCRGVEGSTQDRNIVPVAPGLLVRQGVDVGQVGEGLEAMELRPCHDVDVVIVSGQGAQRVLSLKIGL